MQHHLLFSRMTGTKILQLNINTKHRQSFSWKAVVNQVIDCVSMSGVPEKEETEKKGFKIES